MHPLILGLSLLSQPIGHQTAALPVEALLYSTMPSTNAHRPEMAMDGDSKTSFRTVYGMGDGDDFRILLSRPITTKSIRITTGSDGKDTLTNAIIETSADGKTYKQAASFDAQGVATAAGLSEPVIAIRIRMNKNKAASHLQISEIEIDSNEPVTHVQAGPPRGFVDVSGFSDLQGWADRAEKQMESFWPDTAALLYTDGFITPNSVNVIYKIGPRVTPVAATGGGEMTVNAAYARAHADDTGLVVHEAAHVVQSGGSPGWLVEAVADYIRWIKYEPQNFTYNINPKTSTMHDPYRSGAAFLGWCELHYDSKLVTKLNEATRFGRYKDLLFEQYCGKPIEVLYKEFMAAYTADKAHLLTKPVPPSMQPRDLPTVTGAIVSIPLKFSKVGFVADGVKFAENGGFDDGGAAFSSMLLKNAVMAKGVAFNLGPADGPNMLIARGQSLELTGTHKSLWILAAAEDGGQHDQVLTITYADGSTQIVDQNFSDWFEPEDFPGELRTEKMPYRNMADGTRDPRTFYAYAYGIPLDGSKAVKSITLPRNANIRILAISLAD
ncbi:hypothetical protein BH11ARM1_BH11ARM1_00300 [soil metagenome]